MTTIRRAADSTDRSGRRRPRRAPGAARGASVTASPSSCAQSTLLERLRGPASADGFGPDAGLALGFELGAGGGLGLAAFDPARRASARGWGGRRCRRSARRCRAARPSSSAPAIMVGSQSKTTPSSSPMTTMSPGLAPCLKQLVFDAELGQAVGEVADGFLVGEVGLLDPAHGLVAEDAEQRLQVLLFAADLEAGFVDGAGASTTGLAPSAGRGDGVAGGLRRFRPWRSRAGGGPRGWSPRFRRPCSRGIRARARTNSAMSLPSGRSTLFRATRRGRWFSGTTSPSDPRSSCPRRTSPARPR